MTSQRVDGEGEGQWAASWVLIAVAFVLAQAVALAMMGHPFICECGRIDLWHGNPSGPETSQHLIDWYSYTHVLHGLAFYLLLWWIAPNMPIGQRFALAIGIEAAWEVIENTPLIMERYRQSALARGYFGDSVVNSIADTVAAAVGFVLARTLPAWASVVLVIASESFLAYMIRDNLLLNLLQLLYPNEWLSRWQAGG
jgi:hypothetical protein